MGFGVAVLLVGICVLGQPLGFASAEFDALDCILLNGTVLEGEFPSDGDKVKWAKEGVEGHNKLRRKHGVPDLVYNPQLCRSAQWLTDKIAATGECKHTSKFDGIEKYGELECGECWYVGGGPILASKAVEAWYSEIERYDFEKHAPKDKDKAVGHFTQVVWKETKEACMTYTITNGSTYAIVAHYFPPGNWAGTEAEAANVLNPNNANNGHFKTGTILIMTLCVQFL